MFLLRRLLLYVSALFLFVLCGFTVLLGFNEVTNKWARELLDTAFIHVYLDLPVRIIALTVATIFLLLALGTSFSALASRRREKTYKFDSPYGDVKVSLGALEDYLNVMKNDVRGVKDIRPRVFLRKGRIKVYLRATLWSDHAIPDTVLDIQNGAKSYLEDILGPDRVGDIRVFIGKIVQKKQPDKRPSRLD
ncbi:MAG: alkaline shock response membrane anchor protein AmaP [Candidatus Firestonebacteria bacterium]